MNVYGADFSGAENPSKGIYFAQAELRGETLTVSAVTQCDDRLDLFQAIVDSRSPWGLDFPFSYSSLAFRALGVSTWAECGRLATSQTRERFLDFLRNKAPTCEGKCVEHSKGCRCTDAKASSYSSFKLNNPNFRSMTYAGLKLLTYAKKAGVCIYPFDAKKAGVCIYPFDAKKAGVCIYPFDAAPDQANARLYEIYPSHSWKRVGVTRSAGNLQEFVAAFNRLGALKAKLSPGMSATNTDYADAVVAGITLAAAIRSCNIDQDWGTRAEFISDAEWSLRQKEGLIVRFPCPQHHAGL